MTDQTVQIIITLKVKENDLSYQRPRANASKLGKKHASHK
jgi:hypothetical protein